MHRFFAFDISPPPHLSLRQHVRGRILKLPHEESPSQETIDFYHKQYVDEVMRLFDTYKKKTKSYKNKKLIIV